MIPIQPSPFYLKVGSEMATRCHLKENCLPMLYVALENVMENHAYQCCTSIFVQIGSQMVYKKIYFTTVYETGNVYIGIMGLSDTKFQIICGNCKGRKREDYA